MPNSRDLFRWIKEQVTLQETNEEIDAILFVLFDHFFGLSRTEVILGKIIEKFDDALWKSIVLRINSHEPIQYITGDAWFYNRKFAVNRDVLIPRPETELIIDEIKRYADRATMANVLEIGTGSGCISITLAKEFPAMRITATDISEKALHVAARNALSHHVELRLLESDILSNVLPVQQTDILVSNPPYIAWSERSAMQKNVTDFEPASALFVPDNDALIFYKAIASVGRKILSRGGRMVVEINERFGADVSDVFVNEGFLRVEIRKDINGKDRLVCAFN